MAPSNHQLCSQLRQVIWYHLDNDLLDNALFLAGRLHAIDPRNPDSVHLLALCHFRIGQLKAAYDQCRLIALKREHLGCSFVFAQACLGLEKYNDGISALERARSLWEGKDSLGKSVDVPRRSSMDAAAFHCVLGKLLHGNGDIKRAVACYVAALKLNPFMWDAFQRLCDTGATIRPSNIFKDHHFPSSLLQVAEPNAGQRLYDDKTSSTAQHPSRNPVTLQNSSTPGNDPFNTTKAALVDSALTVGEVNVPAKQATGVHLMTETPPASTQDDGATRGPVQATRNLYMDPPNAPLRKSRAQQSSSDSHSGPDGVKLRPMTSKPRPKDNSEAGEPPDPTKAQSISNQSKRTFSGTAAQVASITALDSNTAPQQRRSVRLNKKTSTAFAAPGIKDPAELRKVRATGTRGRSAATSTVGRVVSGNRKPVEAPDNTSKEYRNTVPRHEPIQVAERPVIETSNKDTESLHWLLELLSKLGNGYYALSRYQCQQALQYFQSVPPLQRDTPWVLAQIGKAQFEKTEHALAEKTFAKIRKLSPSRIQDMEIYSTLLWHLKSDLELAFLSHELIETDRLSPEAWCTIGNSFSLQRDHEQALKCFKRATQLHPKFAYGYTLQGHEHVSSEDYDKALMAYRKAIGANSRHYNGWYGIGRVYEKLGKYDMAEKHYRAAAAINPSNSILVCHIGTVLDKQGNHKAALAQYNHACVLAPQSAMSRFRRARTFLRLRMYQDALAEFMVLKDMAPEEANVHFMLGRTYKMLGDKGKAIKHLTIALNLDPKAAPLIKDAMEALGEDDISDEEDDDDEPMD